MRLNLWAVIALCSVLAALLPARIEAKDLSPQEMLEASEASVAKMKATYEDVLEKLKAAREKGDTAAITELNEILTGVKGTLKDAEKNLLLLKEAVAKGDAEAAAELFSKVDAASDKMQEFKGQMLTVGGPGLEGSVEGQMDVQKEESEELPPGDEEKAVEEATGDYVGKSESTEEGKTLENTETGDTEQKDEQIIQDQNQTSPFI